MKRIVILLAGIVALVANVAEARGPRRGNSYNYGYTQPTNYVQTAVPTQATPVSAPASTTVTAYKPVVVGATATAPTVATAASVSPVTTALPTVMTTSYSTSSAQGIANIMASRGVVGHFGGNPGYEGCGMGSTPQAAYNMCCYANSGMATVDVGYAQGANGMWYCCRRYQ